MLSAGYYPENSDGYRENNDSDQTINNLFGQLRITPAVSMQGEVKHRDSAYGDLAQLFKQNNFLSQLVRRETQSGSLRIGLLSVSRQEKTETQNLSYIGLPEPIVMRTATPLDLKTAYLYLNTAWSWGQSILGFNYANLDDNNLITETQFNPKLGLVWNPTFSTEDRSINDESVWTRYYFLCLLRLQLINGFQLGNSSFVNVGGSLVTPILLYEITTFPEEEAPLVVCPTG